MPNFSALRPAHRRCFSCREWGEIVVVHESLFLHHFHPFHNLLITRSSQRKNREYLGEPAVKYSTPVGAGQYCYFTRQRTNFIYLAAIGTQTFFQNIMDNNTLYFFLKYICYLLFLSFGGILGCNKYFRFFLQLIGNAKVFLSLGGIGNGILQAASQKLAHQACYLWLGCGSKFLLLLTVFFNNAILEIDHAGELLSGRIGTLHNSTFGHFF